MPITLHTEAEVAELPEQSELLASRERDEFQTQVDADVLKLKLDTATAGWPKHDPKVLFHRYVVGADDMASLKSVIRRAGTLHKVEPVFYKNVKTPAGHVAVKFHVARKLDKDGKPVADDTLEANGKPKMSTPPPAPDAPKAEAPKAETPKPGAPQRR